jgi:hypothetical protein
MLGVLFDRVVVVRAFLRDAWRIGFPERLGPFGDDALFLLDGVGGTQVGPMMARRAVRTARLPVGTVLFHWHFGIPGEIWTDLIWLRRNRVMAARLARRILAFRRENPASRIHLLAFSGGCGIAVFALESLRGRAAIETLVLACPAISPDYNLAPALRHVRHAFALLSEHDKQILGWGTRVFGTMDRRHVTAAGRFGFEIPTGVSAADHESYERLRQITWAPELATLGHHGGHTGWASPMLLTRYLSGWLAGDAGLPCFSVGADGGAGSKNTA